MKDLTDTLRIMGSLFTICRETAETGNMPSELYADMFELAEDITCHAAELCVTRPTKEACPA